MDPKLYSYLAQERVKELTSPPRQVEPFFTPFKVEWRSTLAGTFYALARKLEPKRYAQRVRLGRG
jgi:hypothetical protein